MCGRFVQTQEAENYGSYFSVDVIQTDEVLRSWNVAPTKQVYAVAEHDGQRMLGTFDWGLVPFWAKDRRIGARLINARVETAGVKPAFRDSLATRRCIVPADGFYEWEPKARGKLPHYFYSTDRVRLPSPGCGHRGPTRSLEIACAPARSSPDHRPMWSLQSTIECR